jgi:hypothetical protein
MRIERATFSFAVVTIKVQPQTHHAASGRWRAVLTRELPCPRQAGHANKKSFAVSEFVKLQRNLIRSCGNDGVSATRRDDDVRERLHARHTLNSILSCWRRLNILRERRSDILPSC